MEKGRGSRHEEDDPHEQKSHNANHGNVDFDPAAMHRFVVGSSDHLSPGGLVSEKAVIVVVVLNNTGTTPLVAVHGQKRATISGSFVFLGGRRPAIIVSSDRTRCR